METFDQLYKRMSEAQLSAPAKCGDLMKVMETVLKTNRTMRERIEVLERQLARGGTK